VKTGISLRADVTTASRGNTRAIDVNSSAGVASRDCIWVTMDLDMNWAFEELGGASVAGRLKPLYTTGVVNERVNRSLVTDKNIGPEIRLSIRRGLAVYLTTFFSTLSIA